MDGNSFAPSPHTYGYDKIYAIHRTVLSLAFTLLQWQYFQQLLTLALWKAVLYVCHYDFKTRFAEKKLQPSQILKFDHLYLLFLP